MRNKRIIVRPMEHGAVKAAVDDGLGHLQLTRSDFEKTDINGLYHVEITLSVIELRNLLMLLQRMERNEVQCRSVQPADRPVFKE